MKALAVLSPSLQAKIEENSKYDFHINDLKIPLAQIELPDVEFNGKDSTYKDYVLVRKLGFSLNYRDLGVIEKAWMELKELTQDSYYPIGSDFCGIIENIGENVKSLSVGDIVIPDCSYPFSNFNTIPGIPTNHASKELEIFHWGKLKKIPSEISTEVASGMSIGTQTALSMIRKAKISEGNNILITSITSNTSLFLLNFLKDIDVKCNVYGLSYSGKNVEAIKNHYPFISEIFKYKDQEINKNLYFDVVFDPFSDFYFSDLVDYLNIGAKYITCGVLNQSAEKVDSATSYKNITRMMATMLSRNVILEGNCLGTSEDLDNGIKTLAESDNKIMIDSLFNSNSYVGDFIHRSFNGKLGKVIMKY